MVTYYVKLNEIYIITATDECRVYNASGVQVATCPANDSINVKAATNKLKLSDDNAVIKKVVNESTALLEACEEHLANSNIHTTAAEKADCLNHITNSTVHVTALEKTNFSNHLNSTSLHLTSDDKDVLSNSKVHYQNAELHLASGERARIANSALRTEDNNFMGESNFYAKGTFRHEAEFLNTVTKSNSETLDDTSILNRSESDARYAQLNKANNFRAINQFHMPLYANSDFYASGTTQFNGTTTFNGEVFFNCINDGYQNLDFCETIELGFVSHATCEARYVFKADSGYVQIKKPNCKTFEDESVLNKSENDTLYAPKTYDTANAILITDGNGNVTASTVISVAELNTLNNNVTNLATKLADLEARLAALE